MMNITTFQFLYQTLLNGNILLNISSDCCQDVSAVAKSQRGDAAKESLQQCIQQLIVPDQVNQQAQDCSFNASSSQKLSSSITDLNVFTCNENTEIQELAYNKPASQSSTAFTGVACFATDGNKDPDYTANSCTHVNNTHGPLPHWWRVDLEQAVLVSYVIIYNRVDGCNCGHRLQNFAVQVGQMTQNGSEVYRECYYHAGPFTGLFVNVSCSRPICGRFVRIIKQPSDSSPLTLCEVEVYGTRAICMRETFSTYSTILDTTRNQNRDQITETAALTYPNGEASGIYSLGTETTQKSSVTEASSASTDHTVTTSGLSLSFTPAREVTNSLSSHTSTGADNSGTSAMDPDLDHTMSSSVTDKNANVSTVKITPCQCRCARNVDRNTSAYLALKLQAQNLTKEQLKNLSIDTKTTSNYLRKNRSVPDDRPTAVAIGSVGVMLLSLVGIVMLVNDIATAAISLYASCKAKRFITNRKSCSSGISVD